MKKLIAILLAFLSVFTLSSCEKMTVEETAVLLLDAVKNEDYEELKKYADDFIYTSPSLPEAVKDSLFKSAEYSVVSVEEISSSEKKVLISVTNLNISDIMKKADAEIARLSFDEKNINSSVHTDDVNRIYSSVLSQNADNKITTEVTLTFTKISGSWVCTFGEEKTAEFMKAFLGGY